MLRKSHLDSVVVQSGAILVRDPQVFGADFQETCWRFIERVLTLDGICSITIDRGRSLATIRYSPNSDTPQAVLRRIAAALNSNAFSRPHHSRRGLSPGSDDRVFTVGCPGDASATSVVAASQPAREARGFRRLVYLVCAGGSFGMSIVGILVPGIPTVPFLLLTSYYLVRSSRPLNELLLQSRTFGPLLRDWQEHGAMRPRVKVATLTIMVGVVTATVLLADLSGPLLILVVLLVVLGMYGVLRVPTLPDDGSRQAQCGKSVLQQV